MCHIMNQFEIPRSCLLLRGNLKATQVWKKKYHYSWLRLLWFVVYIAHRKPNRPHSGCGCACVFMLEWELLPPSASYLTLQCYWVELLRSLVDETLGSEPQCALVGPESAGLIQHFRKSQEHTKYLCKCISSSGWNDIVVVDMLKVPQSLE